MVDLVAPKVNVKYDKNSGTSYIQGSERTMTITYTERNFTEEGLTFDVLINNDQKTVSLNELKTFEPRISVATGTSEKADEHVYTLTFKGDGAYKVIPHIKDTAGNTNNGVTYEDESNANELFILDGTAPKINVTYSPEKSVRENEYFNSERKMTLTITERNFDKSTLKFDLISDGETKAGLTKEELIKNGLVITTKDTESEFNEEQHTDDRNIVYEIEFKNDGFYQLIPYLTDLAGNEYEGSAESEITKYQEFCIDKKAPEVTVKYNDNDNKLKLHNGKYFNQQRIAEVTIKERNFNADDLEFTLTRDGDKQTYKGFSALEQAIGNLMD